ncbi:hypothetical protein [Burkholderia pseudomultivorans]|uniref:Uncharacterized protein n=1 Tax=Burkholderia pseudomultivorans TaxID=1207504 RepID=A0ABU2DZ26_9BURK|nr:hypothetical protein [Burkholderia pseudomultivorans]MDR8728961.1 hypothetical protein [Burkholderia pseudomultivorans]MDR8732681.1 hypothetical protein [Burkholderia pseudomultivorans]MDR8739547.1 hypothetical protein [Burkholderia pseudomultivorans]MDR8752835.1 hypothetical protein [Burkholderia pseudomultivorans]MDR8778122.1 hypothetical protein [Burkholderia pseudomultivorans]
MRTQDIRLDAGQSHIAWFDKGSQVVVLDGALAVTLRHGGLDWLPDAPAGLRRVLAEGECLTIEADGHVTLAANGAGTVRATVAASADRHRPLGRWLAILRGLPAQLLGSLRVRARR